MDSLHADALTSRAPRLAYTPAVTRWLLIALWIGAAPAWAEPEPAAEAESAVESEPASEPDPDSGAESPVDSGPAGGRPVLSLDSLLSPRTGEWEKRATLRGGRDRETWRRDFGDARGEVGQFEGQVEEVQQKLRKASAGGDWSYSPAGAGEAVDPEIMKLRAQLRRDRASLDAARSRLRDLEVEASLAEVPDHWIEPDPAPQP